MSHEPPKRHPKHEEIVRLIRTGMTDRDITAQVHCGKGVVGRTRRMLGIPPRPRKTTKADKYRARITEPDSNGHVFWTGRLSTRGAGVFTHRDANYPAARVAFELRAGREPVGMVKAECGEPSCVAGAHLADEIERRTVRGQERALYGLSPQPWTECPQGHPWDTCGRFEPNLSVYCTACTTNRKKRNSR